MSVSSPAVPTGSIRGRSLDPRPTTVGWAFLFVVLLLPASAALRAAVAAELHLRNGDRVTGELVSRQDGKIVFRSPYLGEFTVAETDAAVVEIGDVPVDSLAGLPPTAVAESSAKSAKPAARPPAAKGSVAAAAPTPPPAPDPAAKPKPAAAPQKPTTQGRWKGKIELGFQQQSGRQDGVNASLRADAERERGRHQLRGNARLLYGELNDRINTERADGSARWRYQLKPRVFSQTLTSYQTDNVKSIDHNVEQNVGVGYALLKKDRHVINIGGGATGQYRQSINIDGFAVLAEIFEDYTYRINGRLTFAQDLLAQYSPVTDGQLILRNGTLVRTDDDVVNFRIRFNSSLQGRLTDRVSMNLRFEYEYDNTIADASAKVDQRISSSLGYAF